MKTKLNIFNFSPMLHKGWRESAKVQKCNVALLHYCRIAQSRAANHFVRFAAMFLMLMTMSIGQVWAGDNVIYFCPSLTWPAWTSSEGIKVQINQKGDGWQWVDYTMSLDGKTYNGHDIYKATVVDLYGGLGAIQFHNDSWGKKEQPFGEQQWTNTSVFNGKMWVGSWIDYTFDAPETLYTITVVNGTPTSVDAGTTTKPTITANAAAQDYSFKQWNATAGVTVTNPTNATTTVSATQDGTVTATYSLDECSLQYAEGTGTSYTSAMSSSKAMSYDNEKKAYYVDITTTNTSFYFRFKKTKEGAVYAADWNSRPNGTRVEANGAKVNANKDVSSWGDKSICYYKANESGHAIRIWFDYANKQTWITEAIVFS